MKESRQGRSRKHLTLFSSQSYGEDARPCSQIHATIEITRNITAVILMANQIMSQVMHRCAHFDLVDDCQCEQFFHPMIFPNRRPTFYFQEANSSVMSIALPTLQKEMKLEPAQVQWMMSVYPLSSVSDLNSPQAP